MKCVTAVRILTSAYCIVSASVATTHAEDQENSDVSLLQKLTEKKPKANETLEVLVYPINAETPEFPSSHGHVRTAICFSGGGSRALSSNVGQMRALTALGVLPHVDAISSVSGGSWASSQYMFAHVPTEQLLGNLTVPLLLTMEVLAEHPPDMGATANRSTNKILERQAIANAALCKLRNATARCIAKEIGSYWINVIGEAMLGPYGLDKDKYMAESEESRDKILEANPHLQKRDFVMPVRGRPAVFVMNGELIAPAGFQPSVHNVVSLQMSPDFAGSPFHPNGSTVSYQRSATPLKPILSPPVVNASLLPDELLDVVIGGGLVSSFGFGSRAPSVRIPARAKAITVPLPSEKLSLSTAIGISSAAYATAVSRVMSTSVTSPSMQYWGMKTMRKPTAKQYRMGDGGSLENTGLLAMLQRKAAKVAVFLNTAGPITSDIDLCDVPPGTDLSNAATSDLSCLFGYCTDGNQPGWIYGSIQVFAREDYAPLLCQLQTAKNSGKAAVAMQTLNVLPNTWWGIEGGRQVSVIWTYLETVRDFEEALPDETRMAIREGSSGPFADFPQYKTSGQNPPQATSLTVEQINLLAAQMEYSVLQYTDTFCKMFECRH
eukprot:TRINITY_DN14155_c0_g2_i1.p1 TRINITY_DN14155_c0_g2~~TRINITY_DN14155_c0_g2_i1.p1  ORF type:complete len:608 (+),score=63.25 TRINITY_DN14155_c0_g2_i1:102-1925(+)